MGLIAKFFVFVGALAAVVFAVALSAQIFLTEKPEYMNEVTAGCYLLGLIGVWAATRAHGWRRRGKAAGLAVLMALITVVVYGGLVYLTVRSLSAILNVDPLKAMADNANYLVASIGSQVLLMLLVAVCGLMLLRSLAGAGGRAWGLAGLGLAVATGSMGAALVMLVYGGFRDPEIAKQGALVLTASFYVHVAAWAIVALALFTSLRGRHSVAAATATAAAAVAAPARAEAAPATAPSTPPPSPAPPSPPVIAPAKPVEDAPKPMAAPAIQPADPSKPVAPVVVTPSSKPAPAPQPAAKPAPAPQPAAKPAPASAPQPVTKTGPAPIAQPDAKTAPAPAAQRDAKTAPAAPAARRVTVVRPAIVQPQNAPPPTPAAQPIIKPARIDTPPAKAPEAGPGAGGTAAPDAAPTIKPASTPPAKPANPANGAGDDKKSCSGARLSSVLRGRCLPFLPPTHNLMFFVIDDAKF